MIMPILPYKDLEKLKKHNITNVNLEKLKKT